MTVKPAIQASIMAAMPGADDVAAVAAVTMFAAGSVIGLLWPERLQRWVPLSRKPQVIRLYSFFWLLFLVAIAIGTLTMGL
ncbi:MAG: hypothetical protein QOC92_3027 [Acidimicrobiaceae bacterium]